MGDKCFYCKKNEASPEHTYSHTMYYIGKRMKLWVGYNYAEQKIEIPRCKECYDKFTNFGTTFFWVLLVLTIVVWIWLCYKMSASLYQWIYTLILVMVFVFSPIWWLFRVCFFSKFSGIPLEEEFDEFPLAAQLLKEGWVKSKPDPASHPNTGDENIAEQQKDTSYE